MTGRLTRQQRRARERASRNQGRRLRRLAVAPITVVIVGVLIPAAVTWQGRELSAAMRVCRAAGGEVLFASSRWFSSSWPGDPDVADGWRERPLCRRGDDIMVPVTFHPTGDGRMVIDGPEFWGGGAMPAVEE